MLLKIDHLHEFQTYKSQVIGTYLYFRRADEMAKHKMRIFQYFHWHMI